MQIYDNHRKIYTPTYQQKSLGTKCQLVPKKVIKWTYRQGVGSYPKPGESVFCIVGCSLADGTDICIARDTNISKYLIGRGQLIKGLQIALSHSKKDEIFKLFITSQYAYEDNKQIKIIPPNSSLIFEITIMQILKVPINKKTQTQIFYQIQHLFQMAQNQMYKACPQLSKTQRQNHYRKALQFLNQAFLCSQKVKYHRGNMRGKVIIKIVNLYIKIKKFSQALQTLQQYEKLFMISVSSLQESKYIYIHAKIKIFRLNGNLKDAKLILNIQALYQETIISIHNYLLSQRQKESQYGGSYNSTFDEKNQQSEQNAKFRQMTKNLLQDYFVQIDQKSRIKAIKKRIFKK